MAEIDSPRNEELFRSYREMAPEALRWYIIFVYQVLISSIRARE